MSGKNGEFTNAPARVAVFGAGMWGAVTAGLLAQNGNTVRVWDPVPEAVDWLRRERRPRYLEGWRLPDAVRVVETPGEALEDCDLCAVVTASKDVTRVGESAAALGEAAQPRRGWVILSKGIEPETHRTVSQALAHSLAAAWAGGAAGLLAERIAVLSGPCIALEVARGAPTSVVVAAADPGLARFAQEVFHSARFRVYTSEDVAGVELGGALKNVIALAAGVCDGLEFGDNAKAALLTRGLREMVRMGVGLGANAQTFSGLAGMGDLIVTSYSRHSRNRRCGEALGRGKTLEEARREIGMAIEGIGTAREAARIAQEGRMSLPICEAALAILEGRLSPHEAVERLMTRDPKPE